MSADYGPLERRAKGKNLRPRRTHGLMAIVLVTIMLGGSTLALILGPVNLYPYAFTPVPRDAYVASSNPITLAKEGKEPTSSTAKPLSPKPTVRAIVLQADRIKLLAGGKLVREIPQESILHSLGDVVRSVNDPAWIAANGATVTLQAALIVEQGATLSVEAPETSKLIMTGSPGTFLASRQGTLRFTSVHVSSALVPHLPYSPFRPFVLASGGTMDIAGSTFSNLGWDWNSSYGVSWGDGAAGSARGSVFEHNFIGVYTARAHDIQFEGDLFRNNDLYGLDPHTYSTKLTIVNVVAEGNKAHGIIFSDNVTGSVVRNSVSRRNGENGIMMDKSSNGNLVMNNRIEHNHGDGLVIAESDGTQVQSNTITDNRVGVRARNSQGTVFTHNTLAANHVIAEGMQPDASNRIHDNGGQWHMRRLTAIGMGTGTLLVLTTTVMVFWRGRKLRRERRLTLWNQPTQFQ